MPAAQTNLKALDLNLNTSINMRINALQQERVILHKVEKSRIMQSIEDMQAYDNGDDSRMTYHTVDWSDAPKD